MWFGFWSFFSSLIDTQANLHTIHEAAPLDDLWVERIYIAFTFLFFILCHFSAFSIMLKRILAEKPRSQPLVNIPRYK